MALEVPWGSSSILTVPHEKLWWKLTLSSFFIFDLELVIKKFFEKEGLTEQSDVDFERGFNRS